MELVAVGEAMLDVFADSGSRHGRVTVRPGGTAVNAALAAAAIGARAAVIARVGNDAAASAIRAGLDAAGVEAFLAVDDDLATGSFVQLGETIVADRGASSRLSNADVVIPPGTGAVFVSGYALLHEDTRPAAEAAIESGAVWTGVGLGATRAASLDELGDPRVLFADRDEARLLTGRDGGDAARSLAEHFEIVCVTLGSSGAVACAGGEVLRCDGGAPLAGSAIGAGDAFAAGVLVGLVRGLAVTEALALGVGTARRRLGAGRTGA